MSTLPKHAAPIYEANKICCVWRQYVCRYSCDIPQRGEVHKNEFTATETHLNAQTRSHIKKVSVPVYIQVNVKIWGVAPLRVADREGDWITT